MRMYGEKEKIIPFLFFVSKTKTKKIKKIKKNYKGNQ